jgi:predicted AAA+ superfamily ATPase
LGPERVKYVNCDRPVIEDMVRDPEKRIQYWRDASGRETDFVIPRGRDEVDAIECKWDPAEFDATALRLFRTYYSRG